MATVRILGVDPGSRLTGFGCVEIVGRTIRHVEHGTLRLSSTSGRAVIPLEKRLLDLHTGLSEVMQRVRPHYLSVERVFFAKNAVSALKLGQARGAILLAGAMAGVSIFEYSPTEVKAQVTGHGQADKLQVERMVRMLLGVHEFETSDASDALALALCHAYQLGARGNLVAAQRSGVEQPHQEAKSKKGSRSLAESLGLTPESVAGRRRVRLGGPSS